MQQILRPQVSPAELKRRVFDLFAFTVEEPATAAAEPEQAAPSLPALLDDDDLDRALLDYFGVRLPSKRCCHGHSTPWAAVHDAFFARSPISVWKASRGFGGKSFTMAALGLVEALFLRADVNILGGSGLQSKRVLEAISKLWNHPTAPRDCLRGEPASQVQRLIWDNSIQALMASQASVRGPHPQRLRLDEIDEMKLSILDSALGQPMSKGWVLSQTVLSSTHQYANGTMATILQRAAAGGWPVHEWCYRECLEPHGWLSMGEVERKRAVITTAMWNTEVELQEPSGEGRAIVTEKVEQAFGRKAADEADPAGDVVITLEPPVPGARYGTGADWAKKQNWTVIVTIRKDVRPMRVVAIRRTQREPWPNMARYLDEQAVRYPGTVAHDNTGIGGVVHDLLSIDADPFNMVGQQRADLLSEYIKAIEALDLLWPEKGTDLASSQALTAAYSEHKYASRDDVYKGSKDGTGTHHLPDTISAGALAWRACKAVEAASATRQPEPGENPNLQAGVQRGRFSSFMRGGQSSNFGRGQATIPTDDDDPE